MKRKLSISFGLAVLVLVLVSFLSLRTDGSVVSASGLGADFGTELVALQSVQSNLFVQVRGDRLLTATGKNVQESSLFRLIRLEDGTVALQSVANGHYVRAGVTQDSLLAAVSTDVLGWETFHLIPTDDGAVALQSKLSGHYVRAGVTQDNLLAAVSTGVLGWEKFQLVRSVYLPQVSIGALSGQAPIVEPIPTSELATSRDRPLDESASDVKHLEPIQINNMEVKSVNCTIQDWREREIRELGNRILLSPHTGVIYPGALVQGKDLEIGRFTPITIPRAQGEITLDGLKLQPNARYTGSVNEVSNANITEAIQAILSEGVTGTASNFSYSVEQSDSYESLLYKIGLDARYDFLGGSAGLKSSYANRKIERKNFVLLKFQQAYYRVSFTTPESPTSVFRDGVNFRDPENQIDEDNPPLYVSDVTYGRMVFLLAESDYSSEDVQFALDAAFKGWGADVKTNFDLSAQEIMSRTKVVYQVLGGDAGLMLEPINTASPQEMFESVKEAIANKEVANFGPNSPGVPIAYTLRYLSTRQIARMSYSVTYGKKECTTVGGDARLTVEFQNAMLLDLPNYESNECDAEAYFDLYVRVNDAPWMKKTIWKEKTEQDLETFLGCQYWVYVDHDMVLDHVSKDDRLQVKVVMWEKDGDYHEAAIFEKTYDDAGDGSAMSDGWSAAKMCADYQDGKELQTDTCTPSQRANNPWGDEYFVIKYRIISEW